MKKRFPFKQNVLLVNITRLGDMLQATPTIAGIKAENPQCRITVVVEKSFEDICKIIPGIDDVIGLDLTFVSRCIAAEGEAIVDAYDYISSFIDDLKRRNFDYSLNMSSSPYTALMIRLLEIPRAGGWLSDEEGHRVIETDWARLFATSVAPNNRQFNSLNLVDVFRCSADVDKHPRRLLLTVPEPARTVARQRIAEAGFTNTGPLIAIQAGASQEKRQWAPAKFVAMAKQLLAAGARLVMTGAGKELPIIDSIVQAVQDPNLVSFAGKTSVPELAAILEQCDCLVTGDTGPMHISVAVDTPVVSMFLASAFGYETGPYTEGSIVIQPVIGCGPCNPNKVCMKTDCHDHIEPHAVAAIALELATTGVVSRATAESVSGQRAVVYRTCFDQQGFYDLEPLNVATINDPYARARAAYRRLWLEELGGITYPATATKSNSLLAQRVEVSKASTEGATEILELAVQGQELAQKLRGEVEQPTGPAKMLGELAERMSQVDRAIEEKGYFFGPMGPLSKMFVYAKENIVGTDAGSLASQMERIYGDLARRTRKFVEYCQ